MDSIRKLLGDRIRKLRKSKGWSQEELANRAYINRSFMGEIERGEASATVDSLEKITNALEITLEELFRNLQPEFNSKFNNLMNKIDSLNEENIGYMVDLIEAIQGWKE